jgi:hypothetical protein
MKLMNRSCSVPVCGLISQYSATTPMPGPDMFSVLRKRLTLRGFIVWDFAARQADFLRDMGEWVGGGRVKYREDVVEGERACRVPWPAPGQKGRAFRNTRSKQSGGLILFVFRVETSTVLKDIGLSIDSENHGPFV